MSKGLKEEIKILVNSLLIPHCKGLTLDNFLKEYSDIESKPFPYKQLGFNSPADFLFSVPDVVRCTTLRSGHVLLQAVANPNVSHIQDMVKRQKNSHSASLKNTNQVLQQNNHYCPPFVRQFPPPPIYASHSNSYQRPLLGEKSSSFTVPNHTNIRPQVDQTFNSSHTMIPSSQSCVSVQYEGQLVAEFQNLLQSCPDGLDTAHVFSLYSNRYKREVNFHQVEPNMTSSTFFKRHEHVFRLWKHSESMIVGLVEPYAARASKFLTTQQSPYAERGSLTGAIPKGQFSKNIPPPNFQSTTQAIHPMFQYPMKSMHTHFQSPTKAMPPQFKSPINLVGSSSEAANLTAKGHELQPMWSALDIRTRKPATMPLQTVATAWNSENSPIDQVTTRSISPVGWQAPSSGDKAVPFAFGVSTPNIKNVYLPETKMNRQAFPSNIDNFDYFFLIVAEVYSPGEFYWFLSENRKAIEDLTDNMTLFYGAKPEYVISREEMYIGQLVAAMYTDNLWYRARITGCHKEMFQVFYVDYGSKNMVQINRIRHLDLHFTQMPLQAFRGRIFGIRPLPSEEKWSFEAGKWFLNLIKGCKIIAAAKMIEETLAVTEYQISTVYSLNLVDTTKENDVHISDYLIENGFAVACEKEQNALVAATSVVECSDPMPKLSPRPSCAFPSSSTISLANQLENTSISSQAASPAVSSRQFDFSNPSIDNLFVYDTNPSKTHSTQVEELLFVEQTPSIASVSVSPERSKQSCVSTLVLKDDRMLYVVEDDGELYLPKPDMLILVPSLDRQVAALRVKFDYKFVNIQTHPHIFSDCAKAGARWMMDSQGEPLSQLVLYSLQHVSLLLFLCSVKDKVVSSALESKRQEYTNKIKQV